LNLLWEVAHSLLYDWNQLPLGNDIYFYIPRIFGATLGDAFTISLIFVINCLFRRRLSWCYHPEKKDYFNFLFLGLLFAILIETKAMLLNQWSYNRYMPLIFGIGLSPLIQLAITSMIALYLASKLTR
jgi:hypothetical protein